MTKDAVAKTWVVGTDLTLHEGVLYSDPANVPGGGEDTVVPSNYALELVLPRASGTRPSTETVAGTATPNVSSNHPIYRAYTGITYRCAGWAMGGSLPYTWSLSDAPTGMTIDPVTGDIEWPNPTGTTVTPTVTVRDAEDTEISEPWTITIGTSGFKFVDASNSAGGRDGSAANPWNSFSEMKAGTSAGDIVYFRTGTYTTNITADNNGGGYVGDFDPLGNWKRLEISGASRSVAWLAYPGEAPVIDGGYVESTTQGNLVRLTGSSTNPIYIDGIKFQNYYHIVLQAGVGGHYEVFRKCEFTNVAQSIDGANSACIDSLSNAAGAPRFYVLYQGNNFHDNLTGPIKTYWQYKALKEWNLIVDNGGNCNALTGRSVDYGAGGPDHKAVCGRFEDRYNVYSNHPDSGGVPDGFNGAHEDAGFGGNMNSDTSAAAISASGEFRYNRVGHFGRPGLRVVDMNNFGSGAVGGNLAGPIYVYRNTGVGRWNVQNSDDGGPFVFYRNLIVNDTGSAVPDRITVSGGTPGSRTAITLGSDGDANLTLSVSAAEDVVIDAETLKLIGDSRTTYLGVVGHELPGVFE